MDVKEELKKEGKNSKEIAKLAVPRQSCALQGAFKCLPVAPGHLQNEESCRAEQRGLQNTLEDDLMLAAWGKQPQAY